ncbi:AEC family transporter [Pseudomonas sp. Choline-3u-10]|jgi:malate permease and related proteins|uniref:AEC family transporter n=1 Tax=Pseudomonadaceae TaxID=135621 RepID=UPI000617FBDD|nr:MULTISPECIES: AEC family transporter [Pseudomonadaceae]MAL37058.1 AEC family transporter [Pseudomonas sp.]MBU0950293.1 AEC family transporter [Gammaproteobacteria bacterium]KJJ62600.1 malate transporter [Pseudomonas sp. 10B238]MBK3793410.1 AEC family transporter [Stutzerimonas stutzeri]MBK3874900.1 AEC family transporter [Stutzerimonas stutzeri]|tara:strand:+ start:368 stop:1309 length:942 start_codon:yes stop_codon:yes gene_type:complete
MLPMVLQTLSVTAPVFVMLFIGVALMRLRLIDGAFIHTASTLVFKATMPTLLFLSVIKADLSAALQPTLLVYYVAATVGGFLLAWAWALWRCPVADRGVYVQGAFRGNNGVVGLALATSLYGDYGLSLGGVLAGLVILLYNSLSAVVLAIYSPDGQADAGAIIRSILRNPLIIGVTSAIPFAYWQIALPDWLMTSGQYFAQLTLPLALICIGGTLSISVLRESSSVAMSSSLMKMVWFPALATLGAWLCGFRGAELGILFLYFGCPTASSSFVMARAVNSNHQLAATIIVITTLGAALTINVGLFLLGWAGWI